MSDIDYFAEVWKGDPIVDKVLARISELEAEVYRLQQGRYQYLHKCRHCNAELPWTDGTDVEYWCQNCGKEQPATFTEVRWTP